MYCQRGRGTNSPRREAWMRPPWRCTPRHRRPESLSCRCLDRFSFRPPSMQDARQARWTRSEPPHLVLNRLRCGPDEPAQWCFDKDWGRGPFPAQYARIAWSDKTSRRIWFNLFPHLPLSKKVAGSRMGKGKGKLDGWIGQLTSGSNIFEFKNLRPGRARYFLRQVQYRLPVKSSIQYFSKKSFYLPWNVSKKISHAKFN